MRPTSNLRAALGIRAHSGWAAVVAVAQNAKNIQVLGRLRINVIDAKGPRANQPYHYAATVPLAEAQAHLDNCQRTAIRLASQDLKKLTDKLRESRYDIAGCVILQASGRALPELPQILASHAMIHTAEGQFFRNVFASACEQGKVPVIKMREREMMETAARELRMPSAKIMATLTGLGREFGPPWTQDQKLAALGAWLLMAARKNLRKSAAS